MASTIRRTATEFLEREGSQVGRGETLGSPQLPGFGHDLTALFDEA